jgi:hypothetical protein
LGPKVWKGDGLSEWKAVLMSCLEATSTPRRSFSGGILIQNRIVKVAAKTFNHLKLIFSRGWIVVFLLLNPKMMGNWPFFAKILKNSSCLKVKFSHF